jgi:chromosome segregation ATPase
MDQPGNHILLRGNQPGAADRMRELLARTVQDHVADQQSNADALEDIRQRIVRQRIEGLEWLAKEIREREIPGMTARLDSLACHMTEAAARPPQWAESLAEHIELLRAQVTPVAELHSRWADVGTVSANVEQALPRLQAVGDAIGQAMDALRSQDERLSKLQHSISKLQQSMETAAARFSRLDNAVAELGQRTGQLDKEISAVKGRAEVGFSTLAAKVDQSADAMTATVDGLAASVTGVGGQVQLVHGLIERLDTRLERLDERLDDQYDRVSAIDSTLTAADTKLGAIGNTLATTDARIGVAEAALVAVDTKLGALDTRMERVDDRLGEHGQGLTSVDGKVGTLGGRLDGLDGRLEGIGARIDGLGEKFGTLDGKLESLGQGPAEIRDAVARIVDAAQHDVTAHLGSLEETVLTLAEALLRPSGRPVPAPQEGTRGLATRRQDSAAPDDRYWGGPRGLG